MPIAISTRGAMPATAFGRPSEQLEMRILGEILTRLKWTGSSAFAELGLSRVGLRAKIAGDGIAKPGTSIQTEEE